MRGISAVFLTLAVGACHEVDTPSAPASLGTASLEGGRAYQAIDLGTLGGATSQALAINDSGQVIGWSDPAVGPHRAFLWDQGTLHDLGALTSGSTGEPGYSEAWAMNDAGFVVGISAEWDPTVVAWEKGDIRDLGVQSAGGHLDVVGVNSKGDLVVNLDPYDYNGRAVLLAAGTRYELGYLNGSSTSALGLNDRGQIVGASEAYQSSLFPFFHPFLWQDGVMIDLGVFGIRECPDPQNDQCVVAEGAAADINQAGVAVGWAEDSAFVSRAFVWQDGVLRRLDIFPAYATAALRINNRGQIAGIVNRAPNDWRPEGFLWDNGSVQVFAPGPRTHVAAMSERGDIVGWSDAGDWSSERAFVFTSGILHDLSHGMPSEAVAVNQRGEVVGYAATPAGAVHAMLWRPRGRGALIASAR